MMSRCDRKRCTGVRDHFHIKLRAEPTLSHLCIMTDARGQHFSTAADDDDDMSMMVEVMMHDSMYLDQMASAHRNRKLGEQAHRALSCVQEGEAVTRKEMIYFEELFALQVSAGQQQGEDNMLVHNEFMTPSGEGMASQITLDMLGRFNSMQYRGQGARVMQKQLLLVDQQPVMQMATEKDVPGAHFVSPNVDLHDAREVVYPRDKGS